MDYNSLKLNYMDYNSLKLNCYSDGVENVKLIGIKIDDLTFLYKYKNLKELIIFGCDIAEDDLINFDFAKFPKLTNLKFKYNCPNISFASHYTEYIINKLDEKLEINNLTKARELYTVITSSFYSIKLFESRYHDYNLSITLDEVKKKFEEIINIIFECEKELYEKDIIKIKKIPFNKSIFNCQLYSLYIDSLKIKEFFKELPDECILIDNLVNLSCYNDYSKYNYLGKHRFTHVFYNYELKLRQNYIYKITDVEVDKDICKIALFPILKNQIFEFIVSDFHEYIAIDKNRKKEKSELGPIDNIILYYKDNCLATILFNKEIEYKNNITHLKLNILNYSYAFINNFCDNMLCINNLPTLDTLIIKCVNETHDNFGSIYESSYFIIDNLPHSLKTIKISGISQDCIDDLKKIPFGCVLEYEITEDEY